MPRIKKTKNQMIVVPSARETEPVKVTKTKKTVLKKPHFRSKEDTLAYFDCLKEQIANNEGIKITKMCSWCRENKGKVAWSKSESRQVLVDKVAQSYLEFGKGLGHLLQASVVKEKGCECKQG